MFFCSAFRINANKKYSTKGNIYLPDEKMEEQNYLVSKAPTNVTIKNQINLDKCEVVHLGIVCSGYKSTLHLMTMLKSIYFYRSNPLHIHIMVNKLSEKVLKTLFDTWDVPQGNHITLKLNNF